MEQRIDFNSFINGFNINRFPFTQFSTETETQRADLFYRPSDYSRLTEAFESQQSILVLGNRGTGKTAILYDIKNTENLDTLTAWIDDFSNLSSEIKLPDFYHFIINKFVEQLFLRLVNEKNRISKLDDEQKLLLVYLLRDFTSAVHKQELYKKIEQIRNSNTIYVCKKAFNFCRNILNYGMSTAILLTSDIVRQHFTNLPPLPKDFVLNKYFPEAPYSADKKFEKQLMNYEFLNRCLKLFKGLGYNKILLFIDKIDEDSRLKNDAAEIAEFIKPVLTDNKLLLNDTLQLIISMWNIPFSFLIDQVRSQKHFTQKLDWERKDLIGVLNQRLSFFSKDVVNDYRLLFDDSVSNEIFDSIFYLSNKNPRDLWHIFNQIFTQQFKIRPESSKLQQDAVTLGLKVFVEEFNYYEYYPKKINSRADSLDIYSYNQHLLRVNDIYFTSTQFKEATGVSGGSVNNYISAMLRMGLIVEETRDGVKKIYKVADPKVEYAINNRLNIRKRSV